MLVAFSVLVAYPDGRPAVPPMRNVAAAATLSVFAPPVVFAVVDFDGGGRLPVELTDADAGEIEIGQRVEMTFRRLYATDGIVNYFWKGRLVRDE